MLPAGTAYTTLELKVNYLRSMTSKTGVVYCEGKVIHVGGRVVSTWHNDLHCNATRAIRAIALSEGATAFKQSNKRGYLCAIRYLCHLKSAGRSLTLRE
ncbi:MAG TPA: hotdog domain-containing protein [Ktedonobacteraceae bacterium]|nr:hotdog domain-containing protein [Ktedonobacteraceae bacterium]